MSPRGDIEQWFSKAYLLYTYMFKSHIDAKLVMTSFIMPLYMVTSHHLSRMFAKVLHDLHSIEACGDRVALIEFWLLPWLESMQLQHYAAEGKSWCLKLRLIIY